jgi:hypothetical protein
LNSITDNLFNFISDSIGDDVPIYPNLYFINNPVEYSQIQNKFLHYIPKVLFFHDESIVTMKKEDLYLFNTKIKNYKKYSFIPSLKNIISNIYDISYGFKQINSDTITNKNKSILFIAEEKNFDNIIFSQIKQKYPDADILVAKNNNNYITNQLINYKICINFYSEYNTLLAASKGCITISSKHQADIANHYVVSSSTELLGLLDSIVPNLTKETFIANHDSITNKYPFDKFNNSIKQIIDEILK